MVREEIISPKPPEPIQPVAAPPVVETKPAATETPCAACGALVESRYAFCWKCGNPLTSESKATRGNSNPPHGTLMSSASAIDDDELTVQHEMRPPSASLFPWTGATQPEHPSSSRGSVLKLIGIGVVAFLLLSLGLLGLTRSSSQVAAVTVPQSVVENTAPQQQQPVRTERAAPIPTATEANIAPSPSISISPEDELLARLRERRMTATNSERPKIFEAFAKIERKYPRDYRFPYERAKLAAKGSKSDSSDEAFKALSVAAERAISAGKASEMLSGLETDKAGDFHRLAQGRQEWTRLVAALKRKDTSLLLVKAQFQ
jgi:hypothetical protein